MTARPGFTIPFAFCCFLSLLAAAPSPAKKVKRHDVIIMKNGDRLTGEVKKLEGGVLFIETDYFSGSVGLDWALVDKVETTAHQVTLGNRERLAGVIGKTSIKDSTDSSVRGGAAEKPPPATMRSTWNRKNPRSGASSREASILAKRTLPDN